MTAGTSFAIALAATEQEVIAVLQRPRIAPKIDPDFLATWRIFAAAERVSITERVTDCPDPADDKFLELAVNGRADVIVTGDDDLLALDSFCSVPIVMAAAFGHAHARQGRRAGPKIASVLGALLRMGFVASPDGGGRFSPRRAAWRRLLPARLRPHRQTDAPS